jgi:uncharacterized protein (DUF608 family)
VVLLSASLKVWIDQAATVDPAMVTGDRKADLLRRLQGRLNDLAGNDRHAETWGDAALCSSITLDPGETKEIHFTLGWYFPHHMSTRGPEMGHMYEAWFKDAEEVNRYLVANASQHRSKVSTFAEIMARSTLGSEMSFCWMAQLTTLIKSSWWTRQGKFAIWEGLGCCGLQTMDITYQGSYPLIALYPELQKAQLEMAAALQRPDGRVPHFFSGDLDNVDSGWQRVDMNPQFVMLTCRDYLWTSDADYLRRQWPHVVSAMRYTASLDTNGDGLPDKDTGVNTYDQWDLQGTP